LTYKQRKKTKKEIELLLNLKAKAPIGLSRRNCKPKKEIISPDEKYLA
jgi:hypothetical protein